MAWQTALITSSPTVLQHGYSCGPRFCQMVRKHQCIQGLLSGAQHGGNDTGKNNFMVYVAKNTTKKRQCWSYFIKQPSSLHQLIHQPRWQESDAISWITFTANSSWHNSPAVPIMWISTVSRENISCKQTKLLSIPFWNPSKTNMIPASYRSFCTAPVEELPEDEPNGNLSIRRDAGLRLYESESILLGFDKCADFSITQEPESRSVLLIASVTLSSVPRYCDSPVSRWLGITELSLVRFASPRRRIFCWEGLTGLSRMTNGSTRSGTAAEEQGAFIRCGCTCSVRGLDAEVTSTLDSQDRSESRDSCDISEYEWIFLRFSRECSVEWEDWRCW